MISAIIIVILVILGLYLVFRKKSVPTVIAAEIKPADYKLLLNEHVAYYQKLSNADKTRFEQLIIEFLQDVNIEGVGTEITELDRVLIASSAVIPIFGFPEWKYQNLTNIILYPDTFDKEYQFEGGSRFNQRLF